MEKKHKIDLDIYLVGGALRDELLGRRPRDRDYLIVNASKKDLIQRGFTPVGKSFQVFLHPKTKDEYTLSQESLEAELGRRDLTINSMAKSLTSDKIIDPYGGLEDLKLKVLKRTSDRFKEDPLRVLRLARLKSELIDFEVHQETQAYVKDLINGPSFIKGLSSERVTLEFEKALKGPRPEHFLRILFMWGVLAKVFPELETGIEHRLSSLERGKRQGLSILWGLLLYQAPRMRDFLTLDSYKKKLSEKLDLFADEMARNAKPTEVEKALDLIIGVDGLRNESLLKDFCRCCELLYEDPPTKFFLLMAKELRTMKFDFDSQESPESIVREARLKKIKDLMSK